MAITGYQILASAQKYAGVPYFEGNPQGVPPAAKGFDCSGIVQRALADLGMQIPRTTSDQLVNGTLLGYNVGTNLDNAQVGDIIHYVGHEEICAWTPQTVKSGRMVFSEATPGTVAALRAPTPWPVTGIIRYSQGGIGTPVPQANQGTDPGKVSSNPIDLIPGLRGVYDFISGIVKIVNAATNPGFWARVGLAFLGAALLMVGIYGLTHKGNVIEVTSQMVRKGTEIASTS